MPFDTVATVFPPSRSVGGSAACGTDGVQTELRGVALITLADVVFHDAEIDGEVLAGVPATVLIEPVTSTEQSGITRARTLAADGWRVVWLSASDPPLPSDGFSEAGFLDQSASHRTKVFAVSGACKPHPLATGLNGLAG